MDNCPTCGKRITGADPKGCEDDTGQRYCIEHAPDAVLRRIAEAS